MARMLLRACLPPVAVIRETFNAAREHPAEQDLIKQQELIWLSSAVFDRLIAGASFVAALTPA